jgi:hypothetical protein
VNFGVGPKDFFCSSIEEGLSKDGVAIVVIDYDKVLHALGGSNGEASGLVRGDSAGLLWDFLEGCVDAVGSVAILERSGVKSFGCVSVGLLGGDEIVFFRRSKVFPFLIQVSERCGGGVGQEFGDVGHSDAGPCGELAIADGMEP